MSEKLPIPFHPELRNGRFIPKISANRLSLPLYRTTRKGIHEHAEVEIREIDLKTQFGPRRARFFRPKNVSKDLPVLYWIHGGGMVSGDPLNEDWQSIEIARSLGIAVVVPSYRLAPEHPAPAGIDDVADGYLDVVRRATELKIDASRVAIGGASAGGGLAALLAQRLRNESAQQPKVQILVYPMLDDRTVNRVVRVKNMRAWYPKGNRWAWRAFLGQEPGTPTVPTAFVPARMDDLSGLPPAWIGVGTLDLFEAEDREYARRLIHAGVPCDVVIVDGAFHAFDVVFRHAQVTHDFFESWKNALRDSLDVTR